MSNYRFLICFISFHFIESPFLVVLIHLGYRIYRFEIATNEIQKSTIGTSLQPSARIVVKKCFEFKNQCNEAKGKALKIFTNASSISP